MLFQVMGWILADSYGRFNCSNLFIKVIIIKVCDTVYVIVTCVTSFGKEGKVVRTCHSSADPRFLHQISFWTVLDNYVVMPYLITYFTLVTLLTYLITNILTTYLLTHSLTGSLAHSLTYSLTYLLTY
jgi:hypothetical protein